jgi:microsomal dipeptidase-like Zn-dependent dipeptidase
MRRSGKALAAAVIAPLLGPASAAAAQQTRTDPADSPGTTAADLRAVAWTTDAGNARLDVQLRSQSATGQRVLVWADTDADGTADLLVRFLRDTKSTAEISVEPVTAAVAPPCQPFAGDKPIATDLTAPLTDDGETMRAGVSFPFEPAGGRFRWAAYGDSVDDAAPYDFLPDPLAPAAGKDRFCAGGVSADLGRGVRFPDSPPAASFSTGAVEPFADRPFKAVSTATDADGSVVDWRWDTGGDDAFDDGSGPELELRLPAGDHSVALRVTDDEGLSATVRRTVTVAATAQTFPLAAFRLFTERPMFIPDGLQPPAGAALDAGNQAPAVRVKVTPRRPRAGQVVTLDARATRDDGRVATWQWDLLGDGELDDASGSQVRTVFAAGGRKRLAVRARDDAGLGTLSAFTVSVRPARPLPIRAAVMNARRAAGPKGSFERGLGGWKRVGKAFPAKPVRRPTLPSAVDLRTAGRLGGSYASAPTPVNAAGKGWVSSRTAGPKLKGLADDARGDLGTGALVSPAFKVTRRYLTMRVGGEQELRGRRPLQRVEVWLRKGGRARRVATIPAGGMEGLRPVSTDLKRHKGATATVVVIDEGAGGHVNADEVRLLPIPLLLPPPPVVGFADTHSHAMVHQSFGGLLGHRTYMGVPGGSYSDYLLGADGTRKYVADLRDLPSHSAGTPVVRAAMGNVHAHAPSLATGLHEHMHITEIHRAWEGGLRLMSSLAVSNEALEHVTGAVVDRATGGRACEYFGGLCTHGIVADATIPTTRDRQIVEASVHGMRTLARMNASWMEIVYDPDHAYDVMSRGKLAIVLGTEVDSLGNLGVGGPEQEVDWLWSRGIRQVTPVHAIDNAIGSALAFQDVYNTTQDLMNRPVRDADAWTLKDRIDSQGLNRDNPGAPFGAFMRVENWGCKLGFAGTRIPPGECVNWRYEASQTVLGMETNPATGPHPWFITTDARAPIYGPASREDGQRNRSGLAPFGLRYLRALMRRGMLVDIEHMADRTVDAVIAAGTIPGEPRGPVWDSLGKDLRGCEPGGPLRPRSLQKDCYDHAYPVMSSHTTFRGQSLVPLQELAAGVTAQPAVSLLKDNWSREFERTPRQVEYIRDSGGTIAPFALHEPVVRPSTITRPRGGAPTLSVVRGEDFPLRTDADRLDLNDCAGSSKSWITSYLYAVQKMGGRGIALSTDMGVVAAGPRFNPPGADPLLPRSCPAGYANFDANLDLAYLNPRAALARDSARSRDLEEAGYRWQFNRAGQRNPVAYHKADGTLRRPGSILEHMTPTGRVYDLNTEGPLTYGSLPDLLQDAVNVGVDPQDLRPLLRSAQDYVDMWRKAYQVTGCDATRTVDARYERCAGNGNPVDPGIGPCANTCPDSPGRGHERFPDGSRIFP